MNQLSPEARRLFQLAREGDRAPAHALQRAESNLAARISRGAVIAAMSTVATKAAATATATLPWLKLATTVSIAAALSGAGWWGARALEPKPVTVPPAAVAKVERSLASRSVARQFALKDHAVIYAPDDPNAVVSSAASMHVEYAVVPAPDTPNGAAKRAPPASELAAHGAALTKNDASARPTLAARSASEAQEASSVVPSVPSTPPAPNQVTYREPAISAVASMPDAARTVGLGAVASMPDAARTVGLGAVASMPDAARAVGLSAHRASGAGALQRNSPAMPPEDPLDVEVTALRQAQQALRAGQGERVLALLREQERTYPSGALREERAAAKVLALCQVGQTHLARREAERFERSWPKSSLVARLRNCCWKP